MAPTVYLVSGANRGIGKSFYSPTGQRTQADERTCGPLGLGFVTALAQREDAIVFAGVRNPDAAEALRALAARHPGRVHVVRVTACDEAGNRAAVAEVRSKAGRLDVVIANAGEHAI